MTLSCSHRPPCPGCPRFGERGLEPSAQEALALFAREVGCAEPTLLEGPAPGYRCRARLAVRGRARSPKVGIFELGSHRIVHIPHCVVHDERIGFVAHELEGAMRELNVPPYSDSAHAGLVRYLAVNVCPLRGDGTSDSSGADTGAQVTLVLNATEPDAGLPLAQRLAERLGERLHSLWLNLNPERTNAILGPEFHHVHGPRTLRDRVVDSTVHYPPGAFAQKNPVLFETLVRRLAAWVPEAVSVLELYAGTGAIGLNLAARAQSYTFNEVSIDGLAGLERGLEELAPDVQSRARVLRGPAAEFATEIAIAAVVIADPPRKGLDAAILAALCGNRGAATRFIYVSCDVESFLSDARALVAAGWRPLDLSAYAMFPFTDHVETVAVFQRLDSTSEGPAST